MSENSPSLNLYDEFSRANEEERRRRQHLLRRSRRRIAELENLCVALTRAGFDKVRARALYHHDSRDADHEPGFSLSMSFAGEGGFALLRRLLEKHMTGRGDIRAIALDCSSAREANP